MKKIYEWIVRIVERKLLKQQQRPQYEAILSECKMPDLSDLPHLKNRLFVRLMVGIKGLSRNTSLYLRNFIRLLDKSLNEYGEAREAIIEQSAEPSRALMLEFTDHIETCINAVARLHKLLKRMEENLVPLPAELLERIKAQTKSIISIRNSIEHMDERIQKDEIAPGQPIMLILSKDHDGIAVSSHEIKFDDLVIVLRTMHEIAQYILTATKQES